MSGEPKMFRINPKNRETEAISEVNFADLGLRERSHIQEWISTNPGILGDDLLIIGKEFSDFDRTNERLDLLAVDASGKLVIIELKRDDTGADVHWQAIKYASYLRKASGEDIARILADYAQISQDDAQQRLQEHLDTNDLNIINNDQRIIIASHRFAPEVTSAVLWLNEKSPSENLITCVQLVPYQDTMTGTLYLQTNTIIPVPGDEQYTVQIGGIGVADTSIVSSRTRRPSTDVITFVKQIEELAIARLEDELKPDRNNNPHFIGGYHQNYTMWYSRHPLDQRAMQYTLHVDSEIDPFKVAVTLEFRKHYLRKRLGYSEGEIADLSEMLCDLEMPDHTEVQDTSAWLRRKISVTRTALDDDFARIAANTLKYFIEVGTPAFEDFESERNVTERE